MMNADFFDDPKDREIARLRYVIARFKEYDARRKAYVANLQGYAENMGRKAADMAALAERATNGGISAADCEEFARRKNYKASRDFYKKKAMRLEKEIEELKRQMDNG